MSHRYFIARDLVSASGSCSRVAIRIGMPEETHDGKWRLVSMIEGPGLVEDPSGLEEPIDRVDKTIEDACPLQAFSFAYERIFLILHDRFPAPMKFFSVAPNEPIPGLPECQALTIRELFNREEGVEPISPSKESLYAKPHGVFEHETESGTLALQFAHALCIGDFEKAYEMLANELSDNRRPSWLKAQFEHMIAYGNGAVYEVRLLKFMEDWSGKGKKDVSWIYLSLRGAEFEEALSIVVARCGKALKIRKIDWGRP